MHTAQPMPIPMPFARCCAACALAALAAACGGGGGGSGGTDGGNAAAAPPPPSPVPLADAIPAPDATVDPATSGLNLIHVGPPDWTYEYDGACMPSGVALRHTLVDLSEDDAREAVDHKIACALEADTSYRLRVDAVADGGGRHRAELPFRADAADAPGGVTVLDGTTLSRGTIRGLYERYVRDAVLNEIDVPLIGALAAAIVAEIADRTWTELGDPDAPHQTVSESVSYGSRSPTGTPATLTGLVARPRVEGDPDFRRPSRVVLLSHATGSTPSELDRDDGWYVLANIIASRGHLVVAPDNWGRGADDGSAANQPETYLMANRTANNALDFVQEVLADARYAAFHTAPDPAQLAVIGYSQGGHGAVAAWLAAASGAWDIDIRDVHAGGGPHNLYATFRGVLEEVGGRCEGGPWCRDVDPDVLLPYAVGRILPAYLAYADVGLGAEDVVDTVDGRRLSDAFVTGVLDREERFDALKTMLQVSTFTNAVDLAGTVPSSDTGRPAPRIHLYHSPLDRLVPQQNSLDLADALFPGFEVTTHFDVCASSLYEELADLLDTVGAIHAICAFEALDRALRDLRRTESANGGVFAARQVEADPAAPWRALAEDRAATALSDAATLRAFLAKRSPRTARALSQRLRRLDSPASEQLADHLWRESR